MCAVRTAGWSIAATALLLVTTGCAGYQIGTRTLFRPDIRTVYVPVFESDSFRRHLGERLTEAVIKQIEQNSPYKVVSTPNADSVLMGRIVAEQKRTVSENAYDFARVIEPVITAEITWYDRRGDVIFENADVVIHPIHFSVTDSPDFLPEAGQSVGTAQAQTIERIAREIVGQMEATW